MKKKLLDGQTKGMEFFVAIMLSIHHISIFVTAILQNWKPWVLIVVAIALVSTWFLAMTQYRSLRFRAVCTAVLMHTSIVVFSVYSNELSYVLLPFVTVCVLMGLYGIADVIWVDAASIVGLVVYHTFIARTISFQTTQDIYENSIPIANTVFVLFVLHVWIRHRDTAAKHTTRLISELKRAEAIKDDFLTNVSHEIRTPINTINGMSDVALQEKDPAKLREELHAIEYAGRNLMSVVSDILDFSELQSGKMEIVEESYHIQSTINDIIQMSSALKKDKRIDFFVDCDAGLPSSLIGDERKIRRVVMNLISNAFKFTANGAIMLSIKFRKESYGINLVFEVRDTGIGMEPAILEQLFTSFRQADMSRSKKSSGMGLGLAISQIIVQSMGGVITVKSKPQKGTTMTVVIPQRVDNDTPIVQLDDCTKYNLLMYMDMEQSTNGSVRDFCSGISQHIGEQLHVREKLCKNLAEVKRRVSNEAFSHVFIGTGEYLQDRKYFDNLANQVVLTVLIDYMDEDKIINPNIIKLYKPFCVLSLVTILHGSIERGAKVQLEHKLSFEAPTVKVLVVDDNVMNLRVIEGLLLKYRIQVTCALSGKEAITLVRQYKYDLVFMDHMMPEMDGVETFQAIRAIGTAYCKQLPIIALTANAIAGAREQFLQLGFCDFIEKPVESSVLERVLRRTLPQDKLVRIEETAKQEETEKAKEEDNPLGLGDLDIELGKKYCGDEEGYIAILKEYAKKGTEDIEKLDVLYREGDWKNYTILVHAVKSTMLAIGAVRLSEQAKALELAGKQDDIAYIVGNHDCMKKEYIRVMELICNCPSVKQTGVFQNREDGLPASREISEEEFSSIIRKAEEIMFDFNEQAMLELIAPLLDGTYRGVRLKESVEKVVYKIQMADFMSAVDLLKKIKEQAERK